MDPPCQHRQLTRADVTPSSFPSRRSRLPEILLPAINLAFKAMIPCHFSLYKYPSSAPSPCPKPHPTGATRPSRKLPVVRRSPAAVEVDCSVYRIPRAPPLAPSSSLRPRASPDLFLVASRSPGRRNGGPPEYGAAVAAPAKLPCQPCMSSTPSSTPTTSSSPVHV